MAANEAITLCGRLASVYEAGSRPTRKTRCCCYWNVRHPKFTLDRNGANFFSVTILFVYTFFHTENLVSKECPFTILITRNTLVTSHALPVPFLVSLILFMCFTSLRFINRTRQLVS